MASILNWSWGIGLRYRHLAVSQEKHVNWNMNANFINLGVKMEKLGVKMHSFGSQGKLWGIR